MAITLVAAGTYNETITGSNTPTAGGAYLPGDALLIHATEAFFTDTATTPAGWTKLTTNSTCPANYVFAKIAATSSDTIPTITWSSGSAINAAALHIYRGVDPSFTNVLAALNERQSASTQTIVASGSSTGVTANGALILFVGGKNKTSASNSSVWTAPGGYTMLGYIAPTNSSTRCVAAACYQIQTTATAIAANTAMSGSIADSSQTFEATIIALAAASPVQPFPPMSLGGIGVQMCQ